MSEVGEANFSLQEGCLSTVFGVGIAAISSAVELGVLALTLQGLPDKMPPPGVSIPQETIAAIASLPPMAGLTLGAVMVVYGVGSIVAYPFRLARAAVIDSRESRFRR